MVVQVYRKKDVPVDLSSISTTGISQNGNGTTAYSNDKMFQIDPGLFYHELNDEELKVWKMFLPTTYWDGSEIGKTVVNYRFDRIPDEAKEEIRFAIMSGLFDGIEIWTPEGRKEPKDPLAIGALYKPKSKFGVVFRTFYKKIRSSKDIYFTPYRAFMIARWGESLLSYSQIRFEMLISPNRKFVQSNYCGYCTATILDIEKGCGCSEAQEELRTTGRTQHWKLCI